MHMDVSINNIKCWEKGVNRNQMIFQWATAHNICHGLFVQFEIIVFL